MFKKPTFKLGVHDLQIKAISVSKEFGSIEK